MNNAFLDLCRLVLVHIHIGRFGRNPAENPVPDRCPEPDAAA